MFTPKSRYRRIQSEYGELARQALVCAMHVHVDVADDEEAVRVVDGIRPWLPLLVALSANSPFWQGRDTGHASWRSQVWSRWPTAGAAQPFGDVATYRAGRASGCSSWGAGLDPGMLYFDVRLAAHYPTVEIRVADVCTDVEDAALVALLARALVTTVAADPASGRPGAPTCCGSPAGGPPGTAWPTAWCTRSTPEPGAGPGRVRGDRRRTCGRALEEAGDLELRAGVLRAAGRARQRRDPAAPRARVGRRPARRGRGPRPSYGGVLGVIPVRRAAGCRSGPVPRVVRVAGRHRGGHRPGGHHRATPSCTRRSARATPTAARAFFGALFGWTYPTEGAFPGYTFVETGVPGALYTAISPLQGDDDLVTFFVGVEDIEKTLAATASSVAASSRSRVRARRGLRADRRPARATSSGWPSSCERPVSPARGRTAACPGPSREVRVALLPEGRARPPCRRRAGVEHRQRVDPVRLERVRLGAVAPHHLPGQRGRDGGAVRGEPAGQVVRRVEQLVGRVHRPDQAALEGLGWASRMSAV